MKCKSYCFGDLVEKWIDNRGKTPPLSETGIPLLEVKHLPETNLYPKIVGTKFVDEETYASWFRAYLEPNDILFSTVGTTARVVMTPQTETVAIAQNVLGIRFKKDIVDPWFMFYYMRGKRFQHDIEARLITTVQASIKRADMVGIPVSVPQLDIQKELVHRVINIDHKIHLNQAINQTLEQMAQALFKSWFVDFEPVKAKMSVLEAGGSQADATLAAMTAISGKDADALAVFEREHPEQYAELKATAELFPSAMQDCELGEIPVGWESSPLSDKIKLTGGGTPKRSEPTYWDGNICWYSVKDAPNEGDVFVIDTVEKITKKGLDKSSTKILPIGTTIISARGTVGKLALTAVEMAMNQSCYGISGGEFSGPFLTYLKVKQCVDVLKRNTHGAVFDTITTSTFETVVTLTASKAVNHRFEKIVTPLFSVIENNLRTNACLTQLRDTLLPKLLSGEITLPEAVQIISEEA